MSLNSVVLTGRPGKDPELKYTKDGTPVTNVSLAVDYGYGDKKQTWWIKLTAWKKTAETLAKYVHKGTLIGVIGYLEQKTWEDQSGQKRESVQVVVQQLQLLEPKPKDHPENEQPAPAPKPSEAGYVDTESDDIPF